MQRLAITIRLLRQSKKLSLREFAKKAGVGHADIYRLEMGTTLKPSILLISKIARAFGVTIDELMNLDAKECPTCKGTGWVK